MPGFAGDERIGGALDEFLFAGVPFADLAPGKGRFLEEIVAHLVADIPGIEIRSPMLELVFGGFGGHIEHGGQQARLLDAGFPQFQGKRVRGRDGFGDAAQVVDGDAQAVFGDDGEARHAGERRGVGGFAEDIHYFF